MTLNSCNSFTSDLVKVLHSAGALLSSRHGCTAKSQICWCLSQAVVSKSLAAGRSGTLGTSDSLEAHAPAKPPAAGEGSSQSIQRKHDSLDPEGGDMSTSSSVMEPAAPSMQRPGAEDSPEEKPAAAHSSESSSSAESRAGAAQQTLDTGQAPPGQPGSTGQAVSSAQVEQSRALPGEAATAQSEGRAGPAEGSPAEPSAGDARAAPPTPRRASRRRSQADARGLEREHLEGELDALVEKEQEEVGLPSLTGHHQTVIRMRSDRQ